LRLAREGAIGAEVIGLSPARFGWQPKPAAWVARGDSSLIGAIRTIRGS
jgi:hypothetical protein